MTSIKNFVISEEDENLIDILLRFPDWKEVKSGLQFLCEKLEAKVILRDKGKISRDLTGLIWRNEIEVRRWAYKAIALIVDPHRHIDPLVAKIKDGDPDPENMTWAIAALFSIADQSKIEALIANKSLPLEGTSILAANLYGHEKFSNLSHELPTVDINKADSMTLKWSCLLIGYDKAPDNLFHPNYENRTLLGELNSHDDAHVSEYSIWSLYQNMSFDLCDLGFNLDDVKLKEENVRRWIYRLATQNIEGISDRLDEIEEFSMDESPEAREGLARGIKSVWLPELARIVLTWHSDESDQMVKDALLEHMAINNQNSDDYFDVALEEFKACKSLVATRGKIEAASVKTRLYKEVKRIVIFESDEKDLFSGNTVIMNAEEVNMSNNNQKINAKGDVNIGQNVGVGNAIAKGRASVNGFSNFNDEQIRAMSKLQNFLEKGLVNEADAKDIASPMEEISENPSNNNVNKLTTVISGIIKAAKYGATIISEVKEILTDIEGAFGG